MRWHSTPRLALNQGVRSEETDAIRARLLPRDRRFAALSTLAKTLIEKRGHLSEAELDAFLAAGFTKEQILEVITIIAASTITNYAGTSPIRRWKINSSSSPGEDNNLVSEREIEMATQSASAVPQLGELLRYWRRERGKSQLDLSLDTGISQRHLSFVESGRSAPSRIFFPSCPML